MTLHQADTGSPPAPRVQAEAPPQRPPSVRGISLRPAATVLILAVVILAVFVTIGIVSSHQPASVRTQVGAARVAGSTLAAVPAARALSVISHGGAPPVNIVNAVVLPAGSVRVAHHDNGAGGQYDQQVTFRSAASQGALVTFFVSALRQQGWQIFDRGPAAHAPGTTEVLGKLAGSDGYYWEIGALVPPTTFGHGAPPTGETDFTIRLFQVNDTQ